MHFIWLQIWMTRSTQILWEEMYNVPIIDIWEYSSGQGIGFAISLVLGTSEDYIVNIVRKKF